MRNAPHKSSISAVQGRLVLRHKSIEQAYSRSYARNNRFRARSRPISNQRKDLKKILDAIGNNSPARLAAEYDLPLEAVLRLDYAIPLSAI